MATLSLTVETDGFQHGQDVYLIKSLALTNYSTRLRLVCLFDTSELLHGSCAAMRTSHFQSQYHGLPLEGIGLPQECAVPLILGFLQEVILDELEWGLPPPASITLWTKGVKKWPFSRICFKLPSSHHRYQSWFGTWRTWTAPPAQVLLDSDDHSTTEHHAVIFARWLSETGLRPKRQQNWDRPQ